MRAFLFVLVLLPAFLALADEAEEPQPIYSEPTCYQAENPQTLTVGFYSETDEVLPTEQGTSAILKLYTQTYRGSKLLMSSVDVKTDAGKLISATGYHPENDETLAKNRYVVECDGGSMDVVPLSNTDEKMMLFTEYLRADIAGCDGTAKLSTPGTVFTKTQCPQKQEP